MTKAQKAVYEANSAKDDYLREATNTLKASNWTLLMARIFGKKSVGFDRELNIEVHLRHWRGKSFMVYSSQDKVCDAAKKGKK